jgi:hypothetical protein
MWFTATHTAGAKSRLASQPARRQSHAVDTKISVFRQATRTSVALCNDVEPRKWRNGGFRVRREGRQAAVPPHFNRIPFFSSVFFFFLRRYGMRPAVLYHTRWAIAFLWELGQRPLVLGLFLPLHTWHLHDPKACDLRAGNLAELMGCASHIFPAPRNQVGADATWLEMVALCRKRKKSRKKRQKNDSALVHTASRPGPRV